MTISDFLRALGVGDLQDGPGYVATLLTYRPQDSKGKWRPSASCCVLVRANDAAWVGGQSQKAA